MEGEQGSRAGTGQGEEETRAGEKQGEGEGEGGEGEWWRRIPRLGLTHITRQVIKHLSNPEFVGINGIM